MRQAPLVATLLAILLLIVFGWAVVQIWDLYAQAAANVKLGVVTALGSAAAFVINNIVQNSRERRARLFESKREAYAKFFQFFMSIFHRCESERPVDQQEMVQALRDLSTNLLIWGSPATIKAFNQFARESAENPTAEGYELYIRVETLLRALRSDLGHADSSLDKFALSKLIIRGDEHRMLDALVPTA